MRGTVIDASTDPTETYLVSQTLVTKMPSAASAATGASTAKTPHAVATPLPPRNPEPDRVDMADDRGQPGGRRRHGCAGQMRGENHAGDAFPDVERGHQHTGRHAGRTQHVRGAKIAAPEPAQIGRAPPPRQQQSKRHRTDEIGAQDDEGHDRRARANAV